MTRVPLGRTGLRISRVVLGCAPLGGLFSPVAETTAGATVDAAWEHGVRAFDTAPHYGAGLSERRLGAALRARPRGDYLLSTKVGRLLVDGAGTDDTGSAIFAEPSGLGRVRDYSRDAIRRSLEQSLDRLGLDRADIVHVHDAQEHMDVAIREAVPALCELRGEGAIGAVSAGIDFVEHALRFVRECDLDCILTAGRYTLLDHSAAGALLPLCRERGVAYLAAAPFNSGVLADPHENATYWYRPAPREILDRARRIANLCAHHSVGLPAAAVAFPLRHPDVTAVVAGARSPAEIEALSETVPEHLWAELAAAGLIPAEPVGSCGGAHSAQT